MKEGMGWFLRQLGMIYSILGACILYAVAFALQEGFPALIRITANAVPDYLSVCLTINAGLTFEYVRNAIENPIVKKIQTIADAKIAQLESGNGGQINLDVLKADVDSIFSSNHDRVIDCSKIIRATAWWWSIFCVIAFLCCDFNFIQKGGVHNVIFLWPPIYFCLCLVIHRYKLKKQVLKRLKCVDMLVDADAMRQKAISSIQGQQATSKQKNRT